MAIRKVARLGHPVLRQVAREIQAGAVRSDAVQRLLGDLRETMVEYEGVGLAAPQVFEPVRIFVMAEPGTEGAEPGAIRAWINPQLLPVGDERISSWEGCLSIPDLRGQVVRHRVVEITGLAPDGALQRARYEGLAAVIAQHEYDHLEGVVFLDRMESLQTLGFLREQERYGLAPGAAAD